MKINIIMKQPPGPESDFVEVEDEHGASMKLGEWIPCGEYWALSFDTKDLEEIDEDMDDFMRALREENTCVMSP